MFLILSILLLCGCRYKETKEDYNYLDNNTIRFIRKDNNTSLLINKNNLYYLITFNNDTNIEYDYIIKLNDIDNIYTINDIIVKKNDKIELIIDNYDFCIYKKELDKDNYSMCDFIYLYDIDEDFYITLNSDLLVLFYNSYTKFNYKFMYHLSEVWIDSYTIDEDSYLDLTLYEDNFRVISHKIRGKTIHKKINS